MNEHDAEREARRVEHEARRAEHEREREARRAEHEKEREARRAEREAQRTERRRMRLEFRQGLHEDLSQRIGAELGERIGEQVRQKMHRWNFDFSGAPYEFRVGGHPGGAEVSDVVEQRFQVSGMPRVHVSNVSGETEITVGSANEVFVRARKRITGWSEERAKRLLENVEIRMEQNGDEIVIEPRLYEQERGWHELFRGGRVAVDLDVRVPREAHVDARTVSGELSLAGTRGSVEIQAVSGEVSISDVQGPMRLRSVSGDVTVTGYAGQVEANTVSGDLEFSGSRVRTPDIVTVSGDVEIDSVSLAEASEGRVKTVSGDIELSLAQWDAQIDFKTMSGDVEVEGAAQVEKEGRRDRRIILGKGTGRLRVKSVSGDLELRRTEGMHEDEPIEAGAPSSEGTPSAPEPPEPPAPPARDILERLSRGEISVDDAAAALDAARVR